MSEVDHPKHLHLPPERRMDDSDRGLEETCRTASGVYHRAHEDCSGDRNERHAAGLLAVVDHAAKAERERIVAALRGPLSGDDGAEVADWLEGKGWQHG